MMIILAIFVVATIITLATTKDMQDVNYVQEFCVSGLLSVLIVGALVTVWAAVEFTIDLNKIENQEDIMTEVMNQTSVKFDTEGGEVAGNFFIERFPESKVDLLDKEDIIIDLIDYVYDVEEYGLISRPEFIDEFRMADVVGKDSEFDQLRVQGLPNVFVISSHGSIFAKDFEEQWQETATFFEVVLQELKPKTTLVVNSCNPRQGELEMEGIYALYDVLYTRGLWTAEQPFLTIRWDGGKHKERVVKDSLVEIESMETTREFRNRGLELLELSQ